MSNMGESLSKNQKVWNHSQVSRFLILAGKRKALAVFPHCTLLLLNLTTLIAVRGRLERLPSVGPCSREVCLPLDTNILDRKLRVSLLRLLHKACGSFNKSRMVEYGRQAIRHVLSLGKAILRFAPGDVM